MDHFSWEVRYHVGLTGFGNTEDAYARLLDYCRDHFQKGATITRGQGVWDSKLEAQATVSLMTDRRKEIDGALSCAAHMAAVMNEDAVLVSVVSLHGRLIAANTPAVEGFSGSEDHGGFDTGWMSFPSVIGPRNLDVVPGCRVDPHAPGVFSDWPTERRWRKMARRRRGQFPQPKKERGSWKIRYWADVAQQDGSVERKRKTKCLGRVGEMTLTQACKEAQRFLQPINDGLVLHLPEMEWPERQTPQGGVRDGSL